MNKEDVLVLAKAGFNAQQIAAMASVQVQPVAPVAPVTPAPTTANEEIQQLMQQIGTLTQTVQANAIMGSNQPIQTQTTDDILGEIINPKIPETGKKGV